MYYRLIDKYQPDHIDNSKFYSELEIINFMNELKNIEEKSSDPELYKSSRIKYGITDDEITKDNWEKWCNYFAYLVQVAYPN